MDILFNISEDWSKKIANSLKQEEIPIEKILINFENYNEYKKYGIIILSQWIEKSDLEKSLIRLSKALEINGILCMVVPTAFLFSMKDKNRRGLLLKLFHIEGVITLNSSIFNKSTIPCSMLLLDKKQGKSWFTTASNIDELVMFLKYREGGSYKKKNVYYADTIDHNNLMPEHYNGEITKVNLVLDKYETKKLNEVAYLFIGKSVDENELVEEKGFQYIRPRNIVNGKIVKSGVYVGNNHIRKYAKYTLISGDILISKQFGERRIVQVSEDDCPIIASNGLIVIRPTEIPEQYIYNYLNSAAGKAIFNKQLASIETGTTIKNINLCDIKEIRIPIFDDTTMLEMVNVDKLDIIALRHLAERLKNRIPEWKFEQILISQLEAKGWGKDEIRIGDGKEGISIGENRKFIPDIVLKYDLRTIAIIEIKMTHSIMTDAKMQIKSILKLHTEIPLAIITNLKKFDLYFSRNGEHKVFNEMPLKAELFQLLSESEVCE